MGLSQVGASWVRFVAEQNARAQAEATMRKSPAWAKRGVEAYRKAAALGEKDAFATSPALFLKREIAASTTADAAIAAASKARDAGLADLVDAAIARAGDLAAQVADRHLRIRGLLEVGLKAYGHLASPGAAGKAFGRATGESRTWVEISAVLQVLGHQKLQGRYPTETSEALHRAADILAGALKDGGLKADFAGLASLAVRAQREFRQTAAARYALELGLARAKGDSLRELAQTAMSLGHFDLGAPVFRSSAGLGGAKSWVPPHTKAPAPLTPDQRKAARVLGVPESALRLATAEREKAIKTAYRALTARAHPDANPTVDPEIQVQLNWAKDVLLPKK